MRGNLTGTTPIAAALPAARVVLLFGGVVLLSESVVVATTLFAGAIVSFAASVVVGARIYRASASAGRRGDGAAGVIGDSSGRVGVSRLRPAA